MLPAKMPRSRDRCAPRPVKLTRSALVLCCLSVAFGHPTYAQDSQAEAPAPPVENRTTPYDDRLLRISEILGGIHYLRTLCRQDDSEAEDWRGAMQELLDAETDGEPGRRARLTASFNRGYRSFASVHVQCTAAAAEQEARYRREGATLAAEVVARYGN